MNKKTMKIAGWALGLSLAVAGIGAAIGTSHIVNGNAPTMVEAARPANVDVAYTMTPVAGTNNNYNDNCDVAVDGITWNVSGNAQQTPWRLGGKSISNKKRSVYSKTAISSNISFIEIDFGTASSITVNSINFGVYSTAAKAAAGGTGDVANFTPSFKASSTIEITKANSASWSNCFYNLTLNVTVSGSSNKYVQLSAIRFYAASVPLTGISEVNLNHSSVPQNYSKELTATAVYTPDGSATEEINWTSSNEAVATISAGDTYGVGIITIVGQGTCHFTASNKNGSITRDSGDFTVTAPVIKTFYQINFAPQASDGTRAFEDTDAANEDLVGDTSNVSVSAVTNCYAGAGGTLKISGSKNQGSITFTADEDIKGVIVEARAYGDANTSLATTIGGVAQSAISLDTTFGFYAYKLTGATTATEFTFGSNASGKRIYIASLTFVLDGHLDTLGACDYSATLLNSTATGCANLSESALETAWGDLNTAYDATESSYSGAKTLFKATEADASGNLIEQAAARYDYIVGKYLKVLGNEAFADFAARNPAPVNGAVISQFITPNNISVPLVVTIAALGTAAAAGFFLFQRKRKEN